MPRSIVYIEMDGFFASIEQRDRPALRGRPVAVTRILTRSTSPADAAERERIEAVSLEARWKGVREGMSTKAALRQCPDLVILPAEPARYRATGQHVHAILGDFTRRIEPLSLDGCWADLTDGTNVPGLGNATAVARQIRERVRAELAMTCSIGVAPLKFVARLASHHRKPDGLTVVQPEQVSAFVHPIPVERLEGIGQALARRLHARGIRTVGDLAKLAEPAAVAALGRNGLAAWRMAKGSDPRRVSPDRSHRSRAAERTFPIDVVESTMLERELERQIEPIANDLSVADDRARQLTVKVRYASFEVSTRTRTIDPPTRDVARLISMAKALLHDHTEVGVRPVRLVGVSITGAALDPRRRSTS